MRLLSIIIICLSMALVSGCSSSDKINGRSFKTSLQSVKMLKNRLPQEQRIAFEMTFWDLRNTYRKNSEFLEIIDGKTPQELIAIGQESFNKRKAEGFQEFQQYSSWEDMIAKYAQQRDEQNSHKKPDPRDEQNSVLYKL